MSKNIRLHREHGLNATIPVCFLCGKEKNEIAMLGAAYKEKAPMKMCIDKVPCEECQKMMETHVRLIEVKDGCDQENPYRTGTVVDMKLEAAREVLGMDTDKQRACFVEKSALKQILGDLYQETEGGV